MSDKVDKRARAAGFRARLRDAMAEANISQAALARSIGVDRSTISQLLKGSGARLPNAQVVAEAARTCGVSSDWLLNLSDRPERVADVLDSALALPEARRALIDEQIFNWHREAQGYKIRHVPAGLPDMLKTHDMLVWEYEPHLGRTTQQAIGASQDRLTWMQSSGSDYEIALPIFEMESMAHGTGYYSGLPAAVRRAQIDQFIALSRDLYPRLRLSVFDARRLYSAPVTIFGPLLAALYLGRNYIVFRDSSRIDVLTEHFDQLVREAHVSSRDVPDWLNDLSAGIQG